jgi:hypothetical protein
MEVDRFRNLFAQEAKGELVSQPFDRCEMNPKHGHLLKQPGIFEPSDINRLKAEAGDTFGFPTPSPAMNMTGFVPPLSAG